MGREERKTPKLMGHIIAGYPNFNLSLSSALGICYAGASYLEIQFPFSDPNADGVVIEEACDKSLTQGFKVSSGFELVSAIHSTLQQAQNVQTKLIIMTYANLIYHYGIESFVKKASECGTWGIIVPDLTIECDEMLRYFAKKHKIAIISLIAPKTSTSRMKKIDKLSDEIVYVVARAGITGAKTHFDKHFFKYLKNVRKCCKKPIALGFGINTYEQVLALGNKVDIIVAGSYFVRFITELSTQVLSEKDYEKNLKQHAKTLMNWS